MENLSVTVKNLKMSGNDMVGDLEYIPFYIFLDDYIFGENETIVDDGEVCSIEMSEEKLLYIAYEL